MPHRMTVAALRAATAEALGRDDPAGALAVLREHGRAVALEAGPGFRALVAELPEELWHEDPIVAASLGASYRAPGSVWSSAALGYFLAAEQSLVEADADPADAASIALDHAAALREVGRFERARERVAAAEALIRDEVAVPLPRHLQLSARAALESAILHLVHGEVDAAEPGFGYAIGIGEPALEIPELLEALGGLALVGYARGRLAESLEHAERALSLAGGAELLGARCTAAALCAEALAHLDRDERGAAADAAAHGLEAAAGSVWMPLALLVEAECLAIAARTIEALERVQRAEPLLRAWEGRTLLDELAAISRADLLIRLGQANEARPILLAMPESPDHLFCANRVLAQLHLLGGDRVRAEAAIAACERLGDRHAGRSRLDVLALRAAIALQAGELRRSDVSFDRALHAMAVSGTRAPLRLLPRDVATRLVERAQERAQPPEVAAILAGTGFLHLASDRRAETLTERERLVLAALAAGRSVAETARLLYVSPNTVKTQLRRAYRKLGVTTRQEAAIRARALGLHLDVTPESPLPDRVPGPDL